MGTVARLAVVGWVLSAAGLLVACGDEGDTIIIVTAGSAGSSVSGGNGTSGGTNSGGSASGGDASGGNPSGGTSSGGRNTGGSGTVVDCMDAPATRLRGTVHDPSGTLPLFNVAVYVPNGPLTPLADGASGCARCADWAIFAASIAMTNSAGEFVIDGAPSGTDIPLVIETGKWRREVTLSSVTACADNVVDPELTRLPKNQSEGHIPKMAVVRGASDSLECLVHALGIDDAEFTPDSGAGRVHLYYSSEGNAEPGTGQLTGGLQLPLDTTLYGSLDKMKGYDLMMLGCEGTDEAVEFRPPEMVTNMRDYAVAGGRIFGSHYHASLADPNAYDGLPYPTVVDFASGAHGVDVPIQGIVNTTFPRGEAFSAWLDVVGAASPTGQFQIDAPEHTVNSVAHANARAWVTANDGTHPNIVQFFSFPAPIDGPVCGRMAFADIHVGAGSGRIAFPDSCTSTPATLTPQQVAFAFLFFDLLGCVEASEGAITAPSPQ